MTDKKNASNIKPGTHPAKPGVDKADMESGDPFDSGQAKTSQADYDRNRTGLYGGRPEQRGYDPRNANDPSRSDHS